MFLLGTVTMVETIDVGGCGVGAEMGLEVTKTVIWFEEIVLEEEGSCTIC